MKASKAIPPKDLEENEVLKTPVLYGIFGIFFFLIGLALMVFSIIIYKEGNYLVLGIQSSMILFFSGVGTRLILEQWAAKIILTKNEIIAITWLGNKKVIQLDNINQLSFKAKTLELKIQSETTNIKCSQHLVGFPHLIEILHTKKPNLISEINFPT